MRLALAVTVLAVAAAPARAQFVEPYVGAYRFDDDALEDSGSRIEVDSGLVYGIRAGLGSRGWSVVGSYGRAPIEGTGTIGGEPFSEDGAVELYYVSLEYHLPLPVLDLFVSAGAGGIRTEFDGRDGATDVLVNYGAGASFPLSPLVRLRVDLKDHVDLCDAPGSAGDLGACLDDDTLHAIELSGGLQIGL